MRRVVGTDHIDTVAGQGVAQGIAVGAGLDRRIALDQVAEAGVVAVVEQQVVQAHLSGDALAAHRAGREQRQLAHRGQVQHMQARAEAPGQLHGQARGAVAGVGIADQRVRGRRDEFAVARPPPPLVLHNAGRVLAMGQDDGRRIDKEFFQHLRIIHQHVASGRAHEHLDPGHFAGVEGGNGVEVVAAHPEVKTIVGP